MSNWFGVRDQIFGFADQMYGLTRDSMGNTSFDVFGNETHRARMKNDELYRNAFNDLNKPKPGMSNAEFAQNQLDYYTGLWEGRQRQVWDSYGQADALTAEDVFNQNFMESTPEPMGVGPLDDF